MELRVCKWWRRWNNKQEELAKLEGDVKIRLREEVESDQRLQMVSSSGANSVVVRIVDALAFQIKAWDHGWKEVDIELISRSNLLRRDM